MDTRFIARAIQLAEGNVRAGGGPFGAVIVREGQVIAEGVNEVTLVNDPSAHAEITAIRAAGKALATFDLSGTEIYASCEPCPMCLAAIYWARIGRVYYAANRHDAASAGFADEFIYRELAADAAARRIPLHRVANPEARRPFELWRLKEDKTPY
jgi:guanine deaminase